MKSRVLCELEEAKTNLVEIFLLKPVAREAHLARLLVFFTSREREKLVNDYVVRVDSILGKLLNETLGLVQREELGNANANESGLFLKT